MVDSQATAVNAQPGAIHPQALRLRYVLIRVIVLVFFTLALLEILLSLIDPLGIQYVHQVGFLRAYYTGNPLNFRLMPGDYQLGSWQLTINADQTRAVPESGTGECQAVFFGDSVTFGWGVDDADTFVSRVAAGWPTVETRNAAVTAYNSEQVSLRIDAMTFDHGYYLITGNDADTHTLWGGATPRPGPFVYPGIGMLRGSVSALAVYSQFLTQQISDFRDLDMQPNYDRFIADLEQIAAHGDVTFLMVDGDYPIGRVVRERFDYVEIPPFQTRLSVADGHPDAAGHHHLAEVLRSTLPHPCNR